MPVLIGELQIRLSHRNFNTVGSVVHLLEAP